MKFSEMQSRFQFNSNFQIVLDVRVINLGRDFFSEGRKELGGVFYTETVQIIEAVFLLSEYWAPDSSHCGCLCLFTSAYAPGVSSGKFCVLSTAVVKT